MAYKGCGIYLDAANQSIENGAFTAVNFDGELHDTEGWHSQVDNLNRVTVDVSGYYHLHAQVRFDADAGAAGHRTIRIRHEGVTILFEFIEGATDEDMVLAVSGTIYIAATDYVEVQVYQLSGGALDIIAGAEDTNFFVDLVGV